MIDSSFISFPTLVVYRPPLYPPLLDSRLCLCTKYSLSLSPICRTFYFFSRTFYSPSRRTIIPNCDFLSRQRFYLVVLLPGKDAAIGLLIPGLVWEGWLGWLSWLIRSGRYLSEEKDIVTLLDR